MMLHFILRVGMSVIIFLQHTELAFFSLNFISKTTPLQGPVVSKFHVYLDSFDLIN